MDGERFGPYLVHECLGAGGMAIVHRASIELENDDTREVALKRLLPQFADDKRFVDDLIREGKLAAQLDHPNIVRILELGRIGRTYFIAMDLVRGTSLMTLMQRSLDRDARPSLGAVIALMREMLDALDHAHAAQIVHRDLTPSNLIVTEDGHLKVIDFGVAKALVGALQTSSGLAKGKLGYMSIEAVSGKHVDTRADIFSAGVVMWELIALRRLFHGDTDIQVLNAIREGAVEFPSIHNPSCPPELDDIVLKALNKSRELRWSCAGEMAEALDELRLYYPTAERDVMSWLDELHAGGDTATQGFAGESSEYVVAIGSGSATYDEVSPSPESATYNEIVIQADPPSDGGRFLDVDTVISNYGERRR